MGTSMSYQFLPEQESSLGEQALDLGKGVVRQGARTASNLGTLGLGLTGDIFSAINEYVARPTVDAFGGKSVPYEETLLGKAIPTTETHRKNIESVSGDYLRPQNDIERFFDDTIDLAATMINPSKLVSKAPQIIPKSQQVLRSFAKSLGANMAGDVVKEASGNEGLGASTKIGGLVLMSLLDKKKAGKYVGELYQNAEKLLPKGAAGDATILNNRLETLGNQVLKGRPIENLSTAERFVIDQVEDVKRLIQNGKIPIEQAWAQKKTIGQNTAKLWDVSKDYDAVKNAKRQSKQVVHALNDSIKEYGQTQNKPFLKNYKEANEAFSTIVDSEWIKKAGKFLSDYVPSTKGLMSLVAPGLEIGLGATAAYPTAKLLYRIGQSPTLRKLYLDNVKAAGQENALAFNRSLRLLDEKLKEEESKDRFEFID